MILDVDAELRPALEAALESERDAFLTCLAEDGEQAAADDVRCLSTVASWLVEMPALRIADAQALAFLASVLDDRAMVAMADNRFTDARDLLSVRISLQPVA